MWIAFVISVNCLFMIRVAIISNKQRNINWLNRVTVSLLQCGEEKFKIIFNWETQWMPLESIVARGNPLHLDGCRAYLLRCQGELSESEPAYECIGNKGYQPPICCALLTLSKLTSVPPRPWLCSKPTQRCHSIITILRPNTSELYSESIYKHI